MPADYNLIHRMERFSVNVHEEIKREQVTHPIDDYTEERVATLLAKMAEAKRWWPGMAKVNV